MATKNLARTVIEGGRTNWSRWFRRHTNGEQRAQQRAALARVTQPAEWNALVVPPRRKAYRAFHDKLGPPRRWLERQVGRPWSLVRSELFARFDPRSTAGRHIVFDHMLAWVDDDGDVTDRYVDFVVDPHGILRRILRKRHRRTHVPLPCPQSELERWLAGRRVGSRGETLFWFTLTPGGAYRQDHRLSAEDLALWNKLPTNFREQHDPFTSPQAAPARS